MSSRLSYLYRDSHNDKTFACVVVDGNMCFEDIQPYLEDGLLFVPSEVSFQDLQELPLRSCDHIWHEIEGIENVDEAPTVSITAPELIAKFREASESSWNTMDVFRRMGLM